MRNGLDGPNSSRLCSGFEKGKLERHFDKHGAELGMKNKRVYQDAAVAFMEKLLSETMEEITMPDGRICRVDHETGFVGSITKDHKVSTLFSTKGEKNSTVDFINKWIGLAKEGKNK